MEGCRADIDTHCDQVTPGEQRLMACVHAHDDKVSDECKRDARDALLPVKSDIAQANFVGKPCGSDILAHCGDVEPGDRRNEGLPGREERRPLPDLPSGPRQPASLIGRQPPPARTAAWRSRGCGLKPDNKG